jgi:hypothetical protein
MLPVILSISSLAMIFDVRIITSCHLLTVKALSSQLNTAIRDRKNVRETLIYSTASVWLARI